MDNKKVIHVSFDVVSMFHSISKDVGLKQCEMHLNKITQNAYGKHWISFYQHIPHLLFHFVMEKNLLSYDIRKQNV